MAGTIKDYRKMVDEPWGRMFYDLIYRQLDISDEKKLNILDFGAGFCLTAAHYAANHNVTAVEPNEEMYELRVNDNYTLITKGIEYLKSVEDNTFDIVICHNVLEYTDDKAAILNELKRVLKTGGTMSIVKHNPLGRAFGFAVLNDNPKAALDILSEDNTEDSMFGNRNVYSNEDLIAFLGDEMKLTNVFGIRTFFGLSSNNEIKYTDEWYAPMLELETKACAMEEFKKVSFFNHLIFTKA
jgi:SAM-dependent methyltransferase